MCLKLWRKSAKKCTLFAQACLSQYLGLLWYPLINNVPPKAYKIASFGPYVNVDGLILAALASSCKHKNIAVKLCLNINQCF